MGLGPHPGLVAGGGGGHGPRFAALLAAALLAALLTSMTTLMAVRSSAPPQPSAGPAPANNDNAGGGSGRRGGPGSGGRGGAAPGPGEPRDVLFVMPVAPFHFCVAAANALPQFVHGLARDGVTADLMLVFSNQEDKAAFFGRFNLSEAALPPTVSTSIVADAFPDLGKRGFGGWGGSIVTMKKWYGIHAARAAGARHRFYVALDAEVAILRPVDGPFVERLDRIDAVVGMPWAQGPCKGLIQHTKEVHDYFTARKSSMKFFDEPPGALYFWFADLPVYRGETIDEFFKFVGFAHTDEYFRSESRNLMVYDHLAYGMWMVDTGRWRRIDTTKHGVRACSFEIAKASDYAKLAPIYLPLWVNARAYREMGKVPWVFQSIRNSFYMAYHLDRAQEGEPEEFDHIQKAQLGCSRARRRH